jgi:hypothetical protein
MSAACIECGSDRHHDCEDGRVLALDGFDYRIDTFTTDGDEEPAGLWEITQSRCIGAYGDRAMVERDLARIKAGQLPVECPRCNGSGMGDEPSSDCSLCDSGTLWARPYGD